MTKIVVPFVGELISTGTATQSTIQLLWGGTSSVLYGVPIWTHYSQVFTTARVLEIRVRYVPHGTAALNNWVGSGLAGFIQTTDYSQTTPTLNISSFRQANSSAKPFYVGKPFTQVWRPRGQSSLALEMATDVTTSGGVNSALSWGYSLEGMTSSSGFQQGELIFEFLLGFKRF